MRCLYGARFSMTAEVLAYNANPITNPTDPVVTPPPGGWTNNQDPITGEIITEWVPGTTDVPGTVVVEPTDPTSVIVPCFVQGLYNAGIRTSGADEQFGEIYYNTEYVKMWIPGNVKISKRDRITNIKDANGLLVFQDEEYDAARSTVFNVQGVTPRFDYGNRLLDWFLLLEKAQ